MVNGESADGSGLSEIEEIHGARTKMSRDTWISV